MADEFRDAGGYTPGQIRGLKIAIAIMTSAIIVGLAVLIATIAYRATDHKPEAAAPLVPEAALAGVPQTGLPPGAHVTAMTPWADQLLLAVEDEHGTSLLLFDPKTGKTAPMARFGR